MKTDKDLFLISNIDLTTVLTSFASLCEERNALLSIAYPLFGEVLKNREEEGLVLIMPELKIDVKAEIPMSLEVEVDFFFEINNIATN